MLPYASILVWVTPLIASMLMPLTALHPKVRDTFPVVIGFVTAIFAASMIPDVLHGGSIELSMVWVSILGLFQIQIGTLVDPLSVFMCNVVTWIGALILLYSLGYMAGDESMLRYWFFMLLFIGSMVGLVIADNFLSLYIFWEMVGLCSYALIGFWYKRPEARKAGMKAFIVTRVGDIFLLAGIILIYLNVGSFSFSALENALKVEWVKPVFSTIPILLLLGAIGKSAQLPLHTWLPDAMEGPTTVSALIHAATMVKAGVYLMARTHLIYMSVAPTVWLTALVWVGALTAFVSATAGLAAVDIKRVWAYSTISQIGYMMSALGLAVGAGVFVSQFHLMSHAVFKALLFLTAGVIIHSLGGMRDMRNYGGLRHDMPITFLTCLFGVFALSGIAPFNGFWSKDLIFKTALDTGQLAVFIILYITAIITVAYSFRAVFLTFFGEKSEYAKKFHIHEPKVMIIPLLILAFFTVVTGFLEHDFASFMGIHADGFGEIDPVILGFSVLAWVVGIVPTYYIYIKKKPSPEIFGKGVWGSIQKMLFECYYIDKFYYLVFVDKFVAGIQKFRKTHSGILSYNIGAVVGGFFLLLLIVFLLGF
ncbi:NADH-quinone oxidoreductase subunit L [Candidatus Bathyarchaeota archaeon]|nr:MAG: NADH-quinone oxidoreductase subunit L [Candidatus Bathyarchaeota archaeon]